ncbi:aspartate/glutamate racemase family protein [Ramlibacter sp.]|uniref:aspartate/glutamate racemase family protein n=1 Tax=Ramlibacter sp. TaxID=1917967 RepID=UPI0035B1F392
MRQQPLHIGIVGCSAEGAALCFRTLCAEGPGLMGTHAHPPVSLHTPSLADYVQALERDDLASVAALMLESADRLQAAGADFLICPDNTIHQAFDLVEAHSPLPWLHIAQVVAVEARRRGLRRLGVLGTTWLMASTVYPRALQALGIGCMLPAASQRGEIGRIIMDELVPARPRPQSTAFLQRVIGDLQASGCDGVVLGCTELPLVLDDGNSPLPTLDSTRLLARAALRRALGLEASR